MPLLNYTTTVSAPKTAAEIQEILRKHHAKSVMIDYDAQGAVESLSFLITTPQGDCAVKLPINVEAVWHLLIRIKEQQRGNYGFIPESQKQALRPQAVRVAWRIVKDWVEAQMAILDTEMVSLDQVFLPYIKTGVSGSKTVYQLFRERQKLLTDGTTG